MNNYEFRKMNGLATPTFREFAAKKCPKLLEAREFTEDELSKISGIHKGIYNAKKSVLVFENGIIAIVPVKSIAVGMSPSSEVLVDEPKVTDEEKIEVVDKVEDKKEVNESAEDIVKNLEKSNPTDTFSKDNSGDTDYSKIAVSDTTIGQPDSQERLDDKTGKKYLNDTKIEVPTKIIKQIKDRIKQLEAAIAKYDNKGYDDVSHKTKGIAALNKLLQHLEGGTLETINHAKVFYSTLDSLITEMLPATLTNFILNAKVTW